MATKDLQGLLPPGVPLFPVLQAPVGAQGVQAPIGEPGEPPLQYLGIHRGGGEGLEGEGEADGRAHHARPIVPGEAFLGEEGALGGVVWVHAGGGGVGVLPTLVALQGELPVWSGEEKVGDAPRTPVEVGEVGPGAAVPVPVAWNGPRVLVDPKAAVGRPWGDHVEAVEGRGDPPVYGRLFRGPVRLPAPP